MLPQTWQGWLAQIQAFQVIQRELREGRLAPRLTTWYRRVSMTGEAGRVRITLDDGIAFFQVMDAAKASYEVSNLHQAMIVLTMTIVLPMVQAAGIDLIWFGIFIVILVEIAQVTPPVGFNLFVLQTMSGHDINYVARASIPFFFMMMIALVIVIAFPPLSTWLPDAVIGATQK